ncbi:RecT family recombinase [Paenibacillus larvae]
MANNHITLTPEINEAFKPEVLQVIRTSICPTASDAEFMLFAHKAATYRLDPFKNEIFFIKYGNTARIQFAAEAYLAKAREKEGFQPPDTQMVCENDEFKVRKNPETKELEVDEHEISFPRGKIIGAYSIAYRDGYRPVTVVMDRSEVEHMFTGQNKDNWNKWTADMFGKHVEQRALKKQYGLEFGEDEPYRTPSEEIPAYEPTRKDITQEVDVTGTSPEPRLEQSKQQTTAETEDEKLRQLKAEMKEKFKKLGITTKEEKEAYLSEHFKMKGDKPTVQEMTGLLKMMDLHIQEKQSADDDALPN